MRHITLADGLRLRFPGRTQEFDEGVEIGMIAAAMSMGLRNCEFLVGRGTQAQARDLASAMGYNVSEGPSGEEGIVLIFSLGVGMETAKPARPALRLVT